MNKVSRNKTARGVVTTLLLAVLSLLLADARKPVAAAQISTCQGIGCYAESNQFCRSYCVGVGYQTCYICVRGGSSCP